MAWELCCVLGPWVTLSLLPWLLLTSVLGLCRPDTSLAARVLAYLVTFAPAFVLRLFFLLVLRD